MFHLPIQSGLGGYFVVTISLGYYRSDHFGYRFIFSSRAFSAAHSFVCSHFSLSSFILFVEIVSFSPKLFGLCISIISVRLHFSSSNIEVGFGPVCRRSNWLSRFSIRLICRCVSMFSGILEIGDPGEHFSRRSKPASLALLFQFRRVEQITQCLVVSFD